MRGVCGVCEREHIAQMISNIASPRSESRAVRIGVVTNERIERWILECFAVEESGEAAEPIQPADLVEHRQRPRVWAMAAGRPVQAVLDERVTLARRWRRSSSSSSIAAAAASPGAMLR